MDQPKENKKWTLVQKILFRFFFIFISVGSWCSNNILYPIFYPRYQNLIYNFSVFPKTLYWLDQHIYHFGVQPLTNYHTISIDSPIKWALMITTFLISLTGCIVWSALDRKRANYSRLNYWFRMYLAYYLFIIMNFYAIFKITVAQMPFPNAGDLFKPLGDYTKIFLLFNFMGASPGYSIFTGSCEFLAAVLVLIQRTRVLGALVMLVILINILSLNVFYNVMQELLVINLLIVSLYILSPFFLSLANFFIFQKADSLTEDTYHFNTPWKKYLLSALIIIPVWLTFSTFLRAVKARRLDQFRRHQKVYQVVSFVSNGDTLPPLLTDNLRIQKVVFTAYFAHSYLLIYNMSGVPSRYNYIRDTTKKTIIFPGAFLKYKDLPGDMLELNGSWKKHQVSLLLTTIHLDTLPLIKEKFIWMNK